MTELLGNKEYLEFLGELKREIKSARMRAHLAVNKELILLYWRIGRNILDRQEKLGWGRKVIEQLSMDLKHEFPDAKGFSSRSLIYMQTFAREFPDYEFTQQVVAQIPWGHITHLLDQISDTNERQWYIHKTIENGWSRNILMLQINSKLYERQGKALTNFKHTLPSETSDLAQQIFKSEYNFEFLGLSDKTLERHLEKSLVDHVRDFLLELGTGFAFMGSQYKLVVGGDEFFVDLVFYHARLHCYVVIELKTGKFQPSYLGQLEFYLTVINRDVKGENDAPTIGLLLCQQSNKVVVEYALSEKKQPLGVAHYVSGKTLPKEYENALPTPEQFQHLLETLKDEKQEE